jgi:hypothetical protein
VTTETRTILEDNKLLDAEDWLLELDRTPTPDDVDVDLAIGACRFVKLNTKRTGFLGSVHTQLEKKGGLSKAQIAVVLKIMRERLVGADDGYRPDKSYAEAMDADGRYTCSDCVTNGEHFVCDTWPQLRRHKQVVHGIARPYAPEDDEVYGGTVLSSAADDTGLDLSSLPDGIYAQVDRTGASEYVFIRVRRVRRSGRRDRRFVYGKIRTGKEWVAAGTIEVRQQVGDTKRLAGMQKIGETYHGEFKTELERIMRSPEAWSKIAGLMLGHCGICGRSLTSDFRELGIGPECIKKETYWTDTPTDYAEMERLRKARKRGLVTTA